MNKSQAAKLQNIRRFLLELPAAAGFDICEPCRCAWGNASRSGLVPEVPRLTVFGWAWGTADKLQEALGINYAEADFMFQYSCVADGYDTPRGPEGIAEFADRVENVLQYYQSIGDL